MKSLYEIYKAIQDGTMTFSEFIEEVRHDMELIDIMEEIDYYD